MLSDCERKYVYIFRKHIIAREFKLEMNLFTKVTNSPILIVMNINNDC